MNQNNKPPTKKEDERNREWMQCQTETLNYNCELDNCQSLKRCQFVLKMYNSIKSEQTQIVSQIDSLHNYSVISMLNDFQHINREHGSITNGDQNKLFQIFQQTVANGCTNQCDIYERHLFPRIITNAPNEQKSKDLKTKPPMSNKNKQDKKEIFTRRILHKYNSYFCHSNERRNISRASYNKFVTQYPEQKSDFYDKFETYMLGERLWYWPDNSVGIPWRDDYCVVTAHYENLKTELLENPYLKMDITEWDDYEFYANEYHNTNNAKLTIARSVGFAIEIYPNDMISIQHLLTLLTYCNNSDLQHIFLQNCRKQKVDDTVESVADNNKYIANWCRLLFESVQIFGKSITKDEIVYRGINKNFIVNSISAGFWSPTSTTTNWNIARGFIQNFGMLLTLVNTRGRGGFNFDCQWLSDFEESERLFYGAALIIRNIEFKSLNNINVKSNDLTIYFKAIQLFQSITTGKPFMTFNNNENNYVIVENALIQMIEQYLFNDNKHQIPIYIQKCFCACTQHYLIKGCYLFIFESDWLSMSNILLNYFVNFTSNETGLYVTNIIEKKKKAKTVPEKLELNILTIAESKWVLNKQQICDLISPNRTKINDDNRNVVGTTMSVRAENIQIPVIVMLSYDRIKHRLYFAMNLGGYTQLEQGTFRGWLHIPNMSIYINIHCKINANHKIWAFEFPHFDKTEWLNQNEITLCIGLCCQDFARNGQKLVCTEVFYTDKQHILKNSNAFLSNTDGMYNDIDSIIKALKKQGNKEYTQHNDFHLAIQYYQKALIKLSEVYIENKLKYKQLLISLHGNLSLMYLKLNNYDQCIYHCDFILKSDIDPLNKKAYWRKGMAYKLMKQYTKAKIVCTEYLKHDSNDKEILNVLSTVSINNCGTFIENMITQNTTKWNVLMIESDNESKADILHKNKLQYIINENDDYAMRIKKRLNFIKLLLREYKTNYVNPICNDSVDEKEQKLAVLDEIEIVPVSLANTIKIYERSINTNCMRYNYFVHSNKWYYEIKLLQNIKEITSNICVGFANQNYSVDTEQFGRGGNSYCYNVNSNKLYNCDTKYGIEWNKNDILSAVLDSTNDQNVTIEFFLNGKSMGVAFDNIKCDKNMYFAFSAETNESITVIDNNYSYYENINNNKSEKLQCIKNSDDEKLLDIKIDGSFEITKDKNGTKLIAQSNFPTAVFNAIPLTTNCQWYVEIMLNTDGLMQIGFVNESFVSNAKNGLGVGDDLHSFAFDGSRMLKWGDTSVKYKNAENIIFKTNDIIGCGLDLQLNTIRYFYNGNDLNVAFNHICGENDDINNIFAPCISTMNLQNKAYEVHLGNDEIIKLPKGYCGMNENVQQITIPICNQLKNYSYTQYLKDYSFIYEKHFVELNDFKEFEDTMEQIHNNNKNKLIVLYIFSPLLVEINNLIYLISKQFKDNSICFLLDYQTVTDDYEAQNIPIIQFYKHKTEVHEIIIPKMQTKTTTPIINAFEKYCDTKNAK